MEAELWIGAGLTEEGTEVHFRQWNSRCKGTGGQGGRSKAVGVIDRGQGGSGEREGGHST